MKKFLIATGSSVALIFGIFSLLVALGAIMITGYSGDQFCEGTLSDPCFAFINFTANTDIYIYPTNETTWAFNTDVAPKEIIMKRSWGKGWRTIDLSKPWSKVVKYAVKFSEGKSYQLEFIGYKHNPSDVIKWGFGSGETYFPVDPYWFGVGGRPYKEADLVGHWPFEGNFNDMSLYGNDGTPENGVSIGRGIKGRGSDYDGVDDYVNVGDDDILDITDNITISAWVKKQGSGTKRTIISSDNGVIYYGYGLYIDESENLVWEEITNHGGIECSISSTSGIGTSWTHVAVTLNGTSQRLYINGQLNNSNEDGVSIVYGSTVYHLIGQRTLQVPHERRFSGIIDEVRIYNRSLSAEEVAELYNSTKTYHLKFKTVPALASNNTGLVLNMKFEGNFLDSSGLGNDGTQIGGVSITKGVQGRGAEFDGDDDYVDVLDVDDFSGDGTISVWFKPKQQLISTDQRVFITSEDFSPSISLIAASDDKLRVFANNGTDSDTWIGPAISSDWNHMLVAYNNTGVHVYYNGVLVDDLSVVGDFSDTEDSILGRYGTSDSQYFNGTIDEFRVYNRTLNPTEILELYNGSKTYHLSFKTDASLGIINESGLVLHMPFDTKDGSNSTYTPDLSGEGNDGNVLNGTILTNEGRFKEAYEFDGVDDYIDCGTSASFDSITDEFTILAWVRMNNLTEAGTIVALGGDGLWYHRIRILYESSGFRFYINANAGSNDELRYVGTITTDTWYHVAFDFNGSKIWTYIDGVEEGSKNTDSSSIKTGERYVAIGDSLADEFNGIVDEVRIYNRSLSANEISNLYNGSKSHHLIFRTVPG